MNVVQFASYALTTAHESLDQVMADVTPKQAFWVPPGLANPIGAMYLHTAYGADLVIHRMLQDKPPIWERDGWASKVGAVVDFDMSLEWSRCVCFDLDAARAYARSVYAVADAYVAGLTAEEMDRVVPSGMGENTTLGQVLQSFVIWHIDAHCGEISALKGVQGQKGYPF